MFATKDDSFEFQNFKTSGKQVIKHVITKVGMELENSIWKKFSSIACVLGTLILYKIRKDIIRNYMSSLANRINNLNTQTHFVTLKNTTTYKWINLLLILVLIFDSIVLGWGWRRKFAKCLFAIILNFHPTHNSILCLMYYLVFYNNVYYIMLSLTVIIYCVLTFSLYRQNNYLITYIWIISGDFKKARPY